MKMVQRSKLQELLPHAADPSVTSFALGLPDPSLFPVEPCSIAADRVLRSGSGSLQYGPPLTALREQVCSLMKRRGVACSPRQVFLSAGGQQALRLLAQLLLDGGGGVIAERHVYPGFRQIVEPLATSIHPVPTADGGMDTESVEYVLKRVGGVRFIYVNPQGHNPLGITMSRSVGRQLVELARRYDTVIVEDDVYGLIDHDGQYLPALRALDSDHVLYTGSFSKILAPGMRLGWIVAPEHLIPSLSALKEAIDIDTCTFTQRIVSAYLADNDFNAHLDRICAVYRERRDLMMRALASSFGPDARWRRPTHGFFVWVETRAGVNTTAVLETLLRRHKVAYLPGEAFGLTEEPAWTACLRLSYSNCDRSRIAGGIEAIARVLRESANRPSRAIESERLHV
jgi:2-aminoadipate transaminase